MKTPKIDVISGILKFHIPVGRNDRGSVAAAYALADGMLDGAPKSWQATLETRLSRVPAPEPAGDGLDVPPALVRTGAAP